MQNTRFALLFLSWLCASGTVLSGSVGGVDSVKDVLSRAVRDESVDNYITMVIENFAIAMRTGIPALGMPILDPFNISSLPIPDINTDILQLKANASDISVSGTSSFTPTYVHVDFDTNRMYLDLHFINFRIDGDYWCDGLMLVIFPVFGDGFFYIEMDSINATGLGGVYVTDDDHLQISELLITAKYDEFVMFFDNILGGGSFGEEVNEALTLLADAILKEIFPLLGETLVPALVNYINDALMQHTIGEIISGILPTPPLA